MGLNRSQVVYSRWPQAGPAAGGLKALEPCVACGAMVLAATVIGRRPGPGPVEASERPPTVKVTPVEASIDTPSVQVRPAPGPDLVQ